MVSTLLAVSSAHDTVHIFKLGSQKAGSTTSLSPGKNGGGRSASPTESMESREGVQGLDGGYEAFIDGKKKSGGVS